MKKIPLTSGKKTTIINQNAFWHSSHKMNSGFLGHQKKYASTVAPPKKQYSPEQLNAAEESPLYKKIKDAYNSINEQQLTHLANKLTNRTSAEGFSKAEYEEKLGLAEGKNKENPLGNRCRVAYKNSLQNSESVVNSSYFTAIEKAVFANASRNFSKIAARGPLSEEARQDLELRNLKRYKNPIGPDFLLAAKEAIAENPDITEEGLYEKVKNKAYKDNPDVSATFGHKNIPLQATADGTVKISGDTENKEEQRGPSTSMRP